MPRVQDRLRLLLNLLRAEGFRSVGTRILERWQERSDRGAVVSRGRLRSAPTNGGSLALGARTSFPVLNILPTPPHARLGGAQIQLIERFGAEAALRPIALLYPGSSRYILETRRGPERHAVEIPASTESCHTASIGVKLERAVRHVTEATDASVIHCENLQGLPQGSLLDLQRSGLRIVLSLHDFYPFCPRAHLLEEPSLRFCHYSKDLDRCRACLGRTWSLDPDFQRTRRQQSALLLDAADALVFPSRFMRERYLELFDLDPPRLRVIAPAAPARPARDRERPQLRGPIRHIAFAGSVKPHKGAFVFEQVVKSAGDFGLADLKWSVYGGGDSQILGQLRKTPPIRVRGYYRARALPRLLERDRVDLVLLPSVVPESFGLVLSQAWSAGVPVIAFDHGAIADRIRAHGGGLLVPLQEGGAGISRLLQKLRRGELEIPRGDEPPVGPGAAARAHVALYRELGFLHSDEVQFGHSAGAEGAT